MFTPIGRILPETFKKNGMAPKVARARVSLTFEEVARNFLPPGDDPGFKVLRFADGMLTVACKSSGVAALLRNNETALLETMKEAGGERIKFLLSPWR